MDYIYLKFLTWIKAGMGVLVMFFVDLFNRLAKSIAQGAMRAHMRAEAAATAKVNKAKQAAIVAAEAVMLLQERVVEVEQSATAAKDAKIRKLQSLR